MIIINITYKASANYKRLFGKRLNKIEMADELAYYIEQRNEAKPLLDFKMENVLNYDNEIEVIIQAGQKADVYNVLDINNNLNFKELMQK